MVIARLTVITLVFGTLGCATVQPVPDLQSFIAQRNPKVLYVHHQGGAILAVTHPRLTGDTLVGVREGVARPVTLPMASIRQITAVQPNKKRTIMLIAGTALVTGVVGYQLAQGHSGDGPQCDYTSRFQFDRRCK